jgi:hypothetical protein
MLVWRRSDDHVAIRPADRLARIELSRVEPR